MSNENKSACGAKAGNLEKIKNYTGNRLPRVLTIIYIVTFWTLFGFLFPEDASATDQGLVAYWSLDEGAGDVILDQTTNGNNGAIHGAVWTEGVKGKALLFDGIASYVDCGNKACLNIGREITVQSWMKLSKNEVGAVVAKYSNHGGFLLTPIFGNSTDKSDWASRFYVRRDGTNYSEANGAAVSLDDWHCLAGTAESNGFVKLYLDGDLVGKRKVDFQFGNAVDHLVMGRYNASFMKGVIDEVRIYDRVLSDDEIRRNYLIDKPVCLNVVTLGKIKRKPVMDGSLADDAWKGAVEVGDFRLLGKSAEPARKQAKVRMMYDRQCVYFGFKLDDPLGSGVKTNFVVGEHDAPVWQDDCIEIFIDLDGKGRAGYYHFAANMLGTQYEESVDNNGVKDPEWNPKWEVTCRKDQDGWTMEVVIPFACFGLERAPDGAAWGISLNREEKELGENSGWPNGKFHDPSCGLMIFGSLKQNAVTQIDRLKTRADYIADQLSEANDLRQMAEIEAELARLNVCARTDRDLLLKQWQTVDKAGTLIGDTLDMLEIKAGLAKMSSRLTRIEQNGEKLSKRKKETMRKAIMNLMQICGKYPRCKESADIRNLQAQYWRVLASEPCFVWAKNSWDNLLPGQLPDILSEKCSELKVVMGVNEWESCSFVISNLSDKDMKVVVTAQTNSLPVVLRQALPVKVWPNKNYYTKAVPSEDKISIINDALPLLPDSLTIPAFQSREIWVTLNSRNMKPGDYRLPITIQPEKGAGSMVDIIGKVYPVALPIDPADMPFYSFVCDYIDGLLESEPDIQQEARTDLFAHYVNVPYLKTIPWPKMEKYLAFDKIVSAQVDFTQCDKAIDLWFSKKPRPKMLGWFLGFETGFQKMQFDLYGELWRRNFTEWFLKFVNHLKSKGLTYNDFCFWFCDETTSKEGYDLTKLVKSIDPNVKLFANPSEYSDLTSIKAMDPYTDIWVPHMYVFWRQKQALAFMFRKGEYFWCYCNPMITGAVSAASPYEWYRLAPWRAWILGVRGMAIWVYMTSPKRGTYDFDMVYLSRNLLADAVFPSELVLSDREKIIPGKRWEAWREGMEDIMYLEILKKAVIHASQDSRLKSSPALEQSRRTLESLPRTIIERKGLLDFAGQAKEEVLKQIFNLQDKE